MLKITPTLERGQVIRYGPALYRVEYVNECRAYIVPLAKRHVALPNGAEFDSSARGVSIAPTSFVEVVTDPQRALDEMELERAEAELAEAKAELARQGSEPTSVTKVTTPGKSAPHRRMPVKPGGGWHPAAPAAFKDGTLAATVWAFIAAHPGLSTLDIVAGVKAAGAVAACVSRFSQAGLIEKR